jgi:hypothetical protein
MNTDTSNQAKMPGGEEKLQRRGVKNYLALKAKGPDEATEPDTCDERE